MNNQSKRGLQSLAFAAVIMAVLSLVLFGCAKKPETAQTVKRVRLNSRI